MILIFSLFFSAALSGVAWSLGIGLQAGIFVLVLATILSGRAASRLTRIDDPFFGFIVGFALVSHMLLVADLFFPGKVWPVYLYLAVVCLANYDIFHTRWSVRPAPIAIAFFASAFAFIWCEDVGTRLGVFRQTGRLQFWVDIIVHAGTIAQFAVDNSIGRGMVLMADAPRPLYHVAGYMPAAVIARIFDIPPLDAAVLIWMPLGILTMAAGIVTLGYALGGWRMAALALAAIALIPAPEKLTLGNGMLGFSWLLETAPGTPYSLGISCGAIAALVYWIRTPRLGLLVTTCALVAACFLVRVNTFIWLAPVIALGIACGMPGLSRRSRAILLAAGLVCLCIFLIAVSWPHLRAGPANFLFSYVEFVHLSNHPTNYDTLYPWLTSTFGRAGAAVIGVGLILIGTLGPWLPIFLLFALPQVIKGKLLSYDMIPFILLAVASILMLLAPIPKNGDISEFRHRAGPILVVVISVWTLRFIWLTVSQFRMSVSKRVSWAMTSAVSALALVAMSYDIAWSRVPTMGWAKDAYDERFEPTLFQAAAVLKSGTDTNPRFVVADQSAAARIIDDAAVLTALSGVPAYISCPQSLIVRDDAIGIEAKRRMTIAEKLSSAPSLDALQAIMTQEKITYFVTTNNNQAPFDSRRDAAIWKNGVVAIYKSR
ncbi:hypothetical protein GR212_04470 [Rhizobium lusitanum]|uniref:Uncharacterized protein n=1 Tax=Rhizobium lusitanum TaxID=293958 RepID=A0A6L9U2W2_9HYPH|nr:hypothetical protein [Rhizobium lusitanum]NEI68818.1 hypothetical protein [Rhizobium lusitanum]